jgi:hypothetical protein
MADEVTCIRSMAVVMVGGTHPPMRRLWPLQTHQAERVHCAMIGHSALPALIVPNSRTFAFGRLDEIQIRVLLARRQGRKVGAGRSGYSCNCPKHDLRARRV